MHTPEQLDIRDLAREFAKGELRPRSAAWDEARGFDDDTFAKLAEIGFLGMRVPEEYGGLDFDLPTYLVALEEIAWGDPALALSVAIHSGPVVELLRRHGTQGQRSAWLPKLGSGEILGAFALSEADAGSDAGAVSTRATRTESGWRLDGEKRWVTNGGRAGLAIVFARTGPDALSAFLVPTDARGYGLGARESTMGMRASETITVTFDGVELSAEALLGEEGAGLALALGALDVGRAGIAAQAVGIGRAAMEHAAGYALEREQFGQAIAGFGAIQWKLAEMARRISCARAVALEAAAAYEAARNGGGYPRTGTNGVTALAAIAKLTASEAATWCADEAVQIYGGYGYMRHYPVEKLLRDAKGTEIYEGTNEIMRHVIAREVLRDSTGA